jgi:Tfp pilus assembly protein PilF
LNECDEAIKIDKNCSYAYYGKACIYSEMNKVQEAIENLNIAAQKDSKWKEEAKKDEDLDNIRNLDEFKKIV